MKKKSAPSKHKPNSKVSKKKYINKGTLGAGFAYMVLAILVIIGAGSLMIGSIIPQSKSPESGQSVIITTPNPEQSKDNLQLYYFQGATYTPTPSPTLPPPQPQQRQGSPGGGSGSGGGDGGSSSPGGSGGGTGGGSGSGGTAR